MRRVGVSGRNTYELVLVRALRHAMNPVDGSRATEELVRLAAGNRSVLERALLRVELSLQERGSAVGERARDALREALRETAGAHLRAG